MSSIELPRDSSQDQFRAWVSTRKRTTKSLKELRQRIISREEAEPVAGEAVGAAKLFKSGVVIAVGIAVIVAVGAAVGVAVGIVVIAAVGAAVLKHVLKPNRIF